MIHYLINFVLCSAVLVLVYYALLSREQLLKFNRFYLLASLVFSVSLPLANIKTDWRSIPAIQHQMIIEKVIGFENIKATTTKPSKVKSSIAKPNKVAWPLIGYLIYGCVTLGLLARLIINLSHILNKTRKNNKVIQGNCKLILTNELIPPHSFFSYIFLNRNDYESQLVPPEILCHEMTHAKQLHSIDVLILELFQAICWFNPIIPIYRRFIKLNHEYLADAAVITQYSNKESYQYLILTTASEPKFSDIALTSEFNYKTIKKRLVMLNTTTPKVAGICRQLAVLPAIAMAALLFSQQAEAQTSSPASIPQVPSTQTVKSASDITYVTSKATPEPLQSAERPKHTTLAAQENVMNEYGSILKKYNLTDSSGNTSDISEPDRARLHDLYTQMSAPQQDAQFIRFVKVFQSPVIKVNATQLENFKDSTTYGVWIDNKRVKNDDLTQYDTGNLQLQLMEVLAPSTFNKEGYHVKVNLTTQSPKDSKTIMATQPEHIEHIIRLKKRNV